LTRLPTRIRYLREISTHITKHFGPDHFVLHEIQSSTVHIDLHVVRPKSNRPYFTVVTSGMSDLDMHVPSDFKDAALAEVCMCLPGDWPLAMDNLGWRVPKFFWPIKILKQSALYPHTNQTWLSWGHTISHSNGTEGLESGVRFAGEIILRPQTFPEGSEQVMTEDGRTINYLAVVPILEQEMAFRQTFGSTELAEKLIEAGITEILDVQRSSVV
jgi:hypothetical protein